MSLIDVIGLFWRYLYWNLTWSRRIYLFQGIFLKLGTYWRVSWIKTFQFAPTSSICSFRWRWFNALWRNLGLIRTNWFDANGSLHFRLLQQSFCLGWKWCFRNRKGCSSTVSYSTFRLNDKIHIQDMQNHLLKMILVAEPTLK